MFAHIYGFLLTVRNLVGLGGLVGGIGNRRGGNRVGGNDRGGGRLGVGARQGFGGFVVWIGDVTDVHAVQTGTGRACIAVACSTHRDHWFFWH